MITYKQNPQLDFQAVLDLYASVGWTQDILAVQKC